MSHILIVREDERIASEMRLLALDRAEKYKTLLIPRFFPLTALTDETYLGSFTWSIPSKGIRYMIEKHAINLWGVPQSPSEIARDYISVKYPKRLRARKAQIEEFRKHRYAPLYADCGTYADCAYVDLRSAYWSILQAVGWDCDYGPGKYLTRRSDVRDFPCPQEKVARNCLVTAGLSSPLQIWTGSEVVSRKVGNPHPNVGIYSLCMDILAAIALDALDFGTRYIHTDGYILPETQVEPFIEYVATWGLDARVKYRGNAIIFGPGTFHIGQHKSKRRILRAIHNTDQIRRGDYRRLKEDFSVFGKKYISSLTS